ncbi:hypothetical protein DFH27DRAFT_565659 [Peziza echinospora]|nr:hypothetical protein DFH27DRAFT_565659 [Peziza echinospora]
MHLRDTAPAVLHNPYTRVHCRAAGPPAHAARIMRRFAAAVIHGIGTIPWQLKATLQHPSASRPPEHFPDHLFAQDGGSDSAGAAAAAMLLQKACGIREQASMRNTSPSEDDWREVNPVVLAHADAGLVRQSTVSNDLVSRRFLPRLPGGGSPVPQCKVDLALGIIFDRLPDGVRVRSRSALAITDKDYFMFVPVETKSPYGSYGDGQYQATLFSAATLIAWDALRRSSPEIAAFDLPPVPAIVIVGYDWFLHWSYWDAEPDHGRITSLGPYHMGSTLTVQGTLKLLDIVRRLKAWAEAEWIVDDFDGTRDRGLWATLQHLLEVCEEAQPSKVENEA